MTKRRKRWILWGFLILMPSVVQAQFSFTTNNGTITITGYTGPDGAVTIPDTTNDLPVTTIGFRAFNQCTNVTSVTIPGSVTTIGVSAFYSCTSLTNVTIPDSVTIIGNWAFGDCTDLASVTIPDSVTTMGYESFAYCSGLTAVYFRGNAPSAPIVPIGFGSSVFLGVTNVLVYYLPWKTGWGSRYALVPTAVWSPQSLVQNGDFETGALTAWTLAGNTTDGFGNIYNGVLGSWVHSGRCAAMLGDIQLASLSQILSTVPGQYYFLSLWLQNPISATNQIFNVNWNTSRTATNTLFSMVNPPEFSWTNLQFLVIATDTNTTLQIQAENDTFYFSLDDISVTPVPLPMLQSAAIAASSFQFSCATTPGLAYQVQFKTNLLQTDWINLSGSFVATNYNSILWDTNAVSSSQQRFYRLFLQAP
jgi:hypothetical protein